MNTRSGTCNTLGFTMNRTENFLPATKTWCKDVFWISGGTRSLLLAHPAGQRRDLKKNRRLWMFSQFQMARSRSLAEQILQIFVWGELVIQKLRYWWYNSCFPSITKSDQDSWYGDREVSLHPRRCHQSHDWQACWGMCHPASSEGTSCWVNNCLNAGFKCTQDNGCTRVGRGGSLELEEACEYHRNPNCWLWSWKHVPWPLWFFNFFWMPKKLE